MIKLIFKEAWLSIMSDKMRTFLTTLGVIIGVCAVVIMVSVGQAIQIYINKSFDSMGGNLLILVPGTGESSGIRTAHSRPTVTLSDIESLKKIKNVISVVGIIGTSGQMVYGSNNWYSRIAGTTEDYLIVRNWEIDKGAMFSDRDIKSARNVIVIGQTVAKELFGFSNPIGKYIRIKNIPFRVVGTLKEKGQSMTGDDEDNVTLVPVTTARQKLKGSRHPKTVDVSFIKIDKEENVKIVQQRVIYKLRARHNLKTGQTDDFSARDLTEIMNKIRSIGKALTILLSVIASISLLVGSIGIMNMMLVSVTERTREIGTRKALGASNKWIVLQFLTEATFISCLGSLTGLFLGIALSQIVGIIYSATVPISVWTIVVSASVAITVGILSGLFPAYKAMKLNPIDALRYQ
ncbi:MAG: FtsX-like permease family protein [Alphaproteobacteria bacterium]|nr:FtsX-like permease family protein [Alphaproteobacteria bacterium]